MAGGAIVFSIAMLTGVDARNSCMSPPQSITAQLGELWSVSRERSLWPLGTICTYSGRDGRSVVDAPGWAPTVVAVGGGALAAVGAVRLASSRARSSS